MPTSINNTIACNEPHASLDVYYGPYDSVAAALEALKDVTIAGVTYHKKHVGLTVGVWENSNTIKEYWFQGGTSAVDFVEKKNGGGLPENIKLVIFDKNGATGTQNSILTDNDSKVCLPEPTITMSGYTFAGWLYGSSTYEPGATVTIGTDTTIQAQWSSSEQKYTVSWKDDHYTTISGRYSGVGASGDIENGYTKIPAGSTVVLTATPDSGYIFFQWTGVPTGITPAGNTLTFTLNSDVSDITGVSVKGYKVRWGNDDGINKISGTADGVKIISGETLIGSRAHIVLEATLNPGYNFNTWEGENIPEGTTLNNPTLTFRLPARNVTANATTVAAPTKTYSIGWDISNVGAATLVTVSSGGTVIGQGKKGLVEVAEGTSITLTGETEDGFGVTAWHGLPDGINTNLNPVSFIVNDTYKSISFSTGELYTLNYEKDKGISSIKCSVNGSDVEDNPIKVVSTADIEIHAEIDDKYEFYKWDYDDSVRVIESTDEYIRFNINNSTQITALSRVLPAISYCATKEGETPTSVEQFAITEIKESTDIVLTSEETQIFVVIPRYYDLICENKLKLIRDADDEIYRPCVDNGLIKDGTSEITDEFNEAIGGIGYVMYYTNNITSEKIAIELKPQD